MYSNRRSQKFMTGFQLAQNTAKTILSSTSYTCFPSGQFARETKEYIASKEEKQLEGDDLHRDEIKSPFQATDSLMNTINEAFAKLHHFENLHDEYRVIQKDMKDNFKKLNDAVNQECFDINCNMQPKKKEFHQQLNISIIEQKKLHQQLTREADTLTQEISSLLQETAKLEERVQNVEGVTGIQTQKKLSEMATDVQYR